MAYQVDLKAIEADLSHRQDFGHNSALEIQRLFILLAIAERLEAMVKKQDDIVNAAQCVVDSLNMLGVK